MVLDEVLAETTEETDRGRGGVEVGELVLVDAVPVYELSPSATKRQGEHERVREKRTSRCGGVDRGGLEDRSGDSVRERSVDDVSVT